MRDGFQRASGTAIYLESTTSRSRDVYSHLGFEVRHSQFCSSHGSLVFSAGCVQVDQESRFGVGSVDEMGIVAKGEAAIGWPCFIMMKVRFSCTLGLLDK